MKKIIVGVFLITLLCSCHQENALKRRNIETDSIVADSSVRLTDDANSPECSIHLNIQYIKTKGENLLNTAFLKSGIMLPDYMEYSNGDGIRKSVDSFVVKYIDDYINFYSKIYKNDKAHPEQYNNRYLLSTSIMSEKNDIITYVANLSSYGGGLYETKQTLTKNFNAETGKQIFLDDIFMHGYEKMLKEIILNKFYDKYNVDDIESLKKKYIFADGNIYIPDNFIIEKDGITFIYCEDEIAPHEEGEIRIKVNNSDIEDLKKPETK